MNTIENQCALLYRPSRRHCTISNASLMQWLHQSQQSLHTQMTVCSGSSSVHMSHIASHASVAEYTALQLRAISTYCERLAVYSDSRISSTMTTRYP
eukprot:17502-Heterococcus_DN1.PRE.2